MAFNWLRVNMYKRHEAPVASGNTGPPKRVALLPTRLQQSPVADLALCVRNARPPSDETQSNPRSFFPRDKRGRPETLEVSQQIAQLTSESTAWRQRSNSAKPPNSSTVTKSLGIQPPGSRFGFLLTLRERS